MKPTTVKNTQINNYIEKLECINDESFTKNIENLTLEHIQKGAEGYAEYALEYPLKNKVVCVDYSRRKLKYKDCDGKLNTDPEMTTIAKKLFESIREKNETLIKSYANELTQKWGVEALQIALELEGYKNGVRSTADGEKSEFLHDFVKTICSKTIPEFLY